MALVNVIDNAVKYSPERSEIRILVQAIEGGPLEAPAVKISVADQGSGVPEEARASLRSVLSA